MRLSGFLLLLTIAFLQFPTTARASTTAETAAICDRAGEQAARASGVPLPVLRAITLTETGRNLDGQHRPWPWTVNMEGVGKWFATREEALAYVMSHHARGARSFDVGCFQINYRWHGNAFASIEDMFDPVQNALYAGRFLRELYAETKSWPKSAGAYHSRTPKFATRYQARFERILARITGAPLPPPAPVEYAHNMTEAPSTSAPEVQPELATPEPVRPPWTPPPPSRLGSLAAIDAMPAGQPLLIRPTARLY